MAVASFSLSVSSRGRDFTIGGSGILDVAGIGALRQAIEDSCGNEGASVMLDLIGVTEFQAEAVAALIEAGDFCRDKGIAFSLSIGPDFLRVLNDAGYTEELLPL
jgi:ABC-type transporter Mla MlaB component